jgi:hypothetical protein
MQAVPIFFKELTRDIFDVTFTLFKIMIPIIIIIKVIEEMGGIVLLSQWLSPIMELVGLPKRARFSLGDGYVDQHICGSDCFH